MGMHAVKNVQMGVHAVKNGQMGYMQCMALCIMSSEFVNVGEQKYSY